jgi:hypothetical protein
MFNKAPELNLVILYQMFIKLQTSVEELHKNNAASSPGNIFYPALASVLASP